MIEETVRDYLSQMLPVPVCLERPERPPEQYVLIEKTGGGYDEGLYTAVLIFQAYAESLYQAAQLNERLKEVLLQMPELNDSICRCDLNSDYNYTAPNMKQYRYQAVYNIIHY